MTTWSGYPATIWGACWSSVQWLQGQLSGDVVEATNAAQIVLQTLVNGIRAIQAYQIATALQGESTQLHQLRASYFQLSQPSLGVFLARLRAVDAFAQVVAGLLPVPSSVAGAPTFLAAGTPAVPDPGLIEALMQFDMESPPPVIGGSGSMLGLDDSGGAVLGLDGSGGAVLGLDGGVPLTPANLATGAQFEATVWQQVFTAAAGLPGRNAAARMAECANTIATILGQLQSGPFASAIPEILGFGDGSVLGIGTNTLLELNAVDSEFLWNQIVTVPTLLQVAAVLWSAPSTFDNQQCMTMRYALNSVMNSVAAALLGLRNASGTIPRRAKVRQGDTLMDIAAREYGDMSRWSDLAQANALSEPWTGPTAGNGVAQYGQKIFIPALGAATPNGLAPPSYEINVLGVDWYFGPIGGAMPAWTGDILLVQGIPNLQVSLDRRVLTPKGSLNYHTDYGSLVPLQLGKVQPSGEAALIVTYASSAIQSDPRVDSIPYAKGVALPGGQGVVKYDALVKPIGQGGSNAPLDLVLAPAA